MPTPNNVPLTKSDAELLQWIARHAPAELATRLVDQVAREYAVLLHHPGDARLEELSETEKKGTFISDRFRYALSKIIRDYGL